MYGDETCRYLTYQQVSSSNGIETREDPNGTLVLPGNWQEAFV